MQIHGSTQRGVDICDTGADGKPPFYSVKPILKKFIFT